MRVFLIILFLVCFKIELFSQTSVLTMKILTKGDTLELGETFDLTIRLQNIGTSDLFIPDSISVSSSLFPNGIKQHVTGGLIKIDVEKLSGFSGIFIEDIVITPSTFIELKPNECKEFTYDFGNEIIQHVRQIDSDLTIKRDMNYDLKISYSNSTIYNLKPKSTFIGTIKSEVVKLYVK